GTFTVTGGAPLVDVSAGPRSLRASTAGTPGSARTAHGIVTVSAREQQKLRSELQFRAELPSGERFTQTLGVSALARSSGLSDIGLGHPVLLAGGGWRLLEQPPSSQAALRPVGALLELLPDLPGQYRIGDAEGRALSIHAGRYDQM